MLASELASGSALGMIERQGDELLSLRW